MPKQLRGFLQTFNQAEAHHIGASVFEVRPYLLSAIVSIYLGLGKKYKLTEMQRWILYAIAKHRENK